MPTYQYACTESACGHRFEAVQSFSDDPLDNCPVCEGRVRKVFSAVGVVFKGSGFYRTDSRQADRATVGASSDSKDNGKDRSGRDRSGKDSSSAGKSESSASSSSSSSGGGSSGSSAKSGATSSGSSSGSTPKAAAS